MSTAISGLQAQSRALGYLSDNVANSQTVGYKRVDANFVSLLTQSSSTSHSPGSVQSLPNYTNTIQGTISDSDNDLALAISGQGFFPVAAATGETNGAVTFDDRQFYTRAGDFSLDENGYLVNGQGYYLQGWGMTATGEPDRTDLSPIQVSDLVYNPVATGSIDLSANLPADIDVGESFSSQIQIYDSLGTQQTVTLSWTKNAKNDWDLSVASANDTSGSTFTAQVLFGDAAATPVSAGTVGEIVVPGGSATVGSSGVTGDAATLGFTFDFGQGPQAVTLNLGNFGQATGLTQYSGTEYNLRNISQDGVPLGSYSGVSIGDNGEISVNYDNGQTRVVGQIPVATFSNPDALQRLDGQAFMATTESGAAQLTDVASNGAGRLVVGSLESSNVDIATEFSKLIVAQRAYTANTKVVTAADEMLQDVLNMRR
ncbi:flagellar hook protein FlgE [Acetobacteraceae bacterium H6797]|nr:flagellar hook protein FlgE [Acetobacteraceae bacterium H6797]